MKGAPGVPKTGLRLADLIVESLVGAAARPARMALTATGIAVGTALLVVTIGLNETGADAVGSAFSAYESREIVVRPADDRDELVFPVDSDERLRALNGVVAAGVTASVGEGRPIVEVLPGIGRSRRSVRAATPGAVAMTGSEVVGASLDLFHEVVAARVAIVPSDLAGNFPPGSLVHIDGLPFTVIGVFSPDENSPLTTSIVIPYQTARRLWSKVEDVEARLDAEPAAIDQLRSEIGLALFPHRPDGVEVLTPPRAGTLRRQVEGTLGTLGLVLGGLALVIGVVAVGNSVLVSVLERRYEIGVRRTLGATRRHVAGQLLLESSLLGFLGGSAGTVIGALAVIALSVSRAWTPILPPWLLAGGVGVGTAVGFLAGVLPALRATKIEPIEVLRM